MKKLVQIILKTLRPMLNIEMICKMFIKIFDEYNPERKKNVLIVFDDMIADMINNKKLNLIVTELFIKSRKLNISIIFIMQSYFKVPKEVRRNTTHFFILKILSKRKLQQIALNHSSDIDFKDFMNTYKKCTADNPLRFGKNLLK